MTVETETITINANDPETLRVALQNVADHIDALHKDVGLLSIALGTLVNAGDAGLLAQPNATRETLRAVLRTFGEQAPLSTLQIQWGLDLPLDPMPPKGRKRLRIVRREIEAA